MKAFSLLDLAPIIQGSTARQALLNSRDLAQHAQQQGYKRFWMAEHHNSSGIASAATAVALGFVAAGTTAIRIGAAGVMLPNHSPLVIAEQFGTLASLYPDRVDLGLGRAPGTDGKTMHALRRDNLDAAATVYEEITGGVEHMKVGGREIHGRAYVSSFNFKGSDQQKLVGDLSGGERNRVHLAKLLKRGGNLLLLDEPTNDLDVDTLRALETALEGFPGCAVVISHDRWFLDRIATHVLAFEGDSQVRWFEGNFSEYEAWRRKELGSSADTPHRIKYKPIAR